MQGVSHDSDLFRLSRFLVEIHLKLVREGFSGL